MYNTNNNRKRNLIVNFAYYFIIILIVYLSLKYILPLITPFVIALLLAIFAEPIIITIKNKTRINRAIISICCTLVIFLVIFLILTLIVSLLIIFAKELPTFINGLNNYFEKTNNKFLTDTIQMINNYVNNFKISEILTGDVGAKLFDMTSGIIKFLPSFSISILVTIASTIMISTSYNQIVNFIKSILPLRVYRKIIKLKDSSFKIFSKYIKSYLLIIVITFIELLILFYIFGFKSPVLLSIFISIIDILPILGIGTIMIPWILICFIIGKYSTAIVLTSIYILVTVIRQIIEPKIIGKEIGLHPVVVLFCVYIGLKTFGIVGVILFPVFALIAFEIFKSYRLSLDNKNGCLYND